MSRLSRVGLAVMLVLALLTFLAACNGGGGRGKTPQADNSDLATLAERAVGDVVAKVTYRVTTESNGETFEVEWVLVQRPPDSRFEFYRVEDGEEFRTIIINAGEMSYLCLSAGGEEICLENMGSSADTSPVDPLFDAPREIAEDVGDVDVINRSQRSIAGVNATCFTVSSALASLGEAEICFSEEGLLLYLQSEVDGATSTFEATSVSTDVTDADFEPPYEIDTFELPGLDIPTPP